jgi:hypothetical protein
MPSTLMTKTINKVTNCLFYLQVLHYRFLTHWHDRFYEKSYLEGKGQGPYSQQGPLFANPLAATLQSPCLLPYTGPIDLRYYFLSLQPHLNFIVIKLNDHSAFTG